MVSSLGFGDVFVCLYIYVRVIMHVLKKKERIHVCVFMYIYVCLAIRIIHSCVYDVDIKQRGEDVSFQFPNSSRILCILVSLF